MFSFQRKCLGIYELCLQWFSVLPDPQSWAGDFSGLLTNNPGKSTQMDCHWGELWEDGVSSRAAKATHCHRVCANFWIWGSNKTKEKDRSISFPSLCFSFWCMPLTHGLGLSDFLMMVAGMACWSSVTCKHASAAFVLEGPFSVTPVSLLSL